MALSWTIVSILAIFLAKSFAEETESTAEANKVEVTKKPDYKTVPLRRPIVQPPHTYFIPTRPPFPGGGSGYYPFLTPIVYYHPVLTAAGNSKLAYQFPPAAALIKPKKKEKLRPYSQLKQHSTYGFLDFSSFGKIVNHGILANVEKRPDVKQDDEVKNPIHEAAEHHVPRFPPSSGIDSRVLTNITICYFVGDDILKSHLMHDANWAFTVADKNGQSTNLNGLVNYINDLTLQTNNLLGSDNYRLKWIGNPTPFVRHSPTSGVTDEGLKSDVHNNHQRGCDVAIFLLFNDFSKVEETEGFPFSGLVKGAACDGHKGEGYAVVVDQGFDKETNVWMGPQILAHHLLRLLTADICNLDKEGIQGWSTSCFCANELSLLHPYMKPGQQHLDQCAVDKLYQSDISIRNCLLDD